jgi:hypothetical protein
MTSRSRPGDRKSAAQNLPLPSNFAPRSRPTACEMRRTRRATDRLKQPKRRLPIPLTYYDLAKSKGFNLLDRGRRSSDLKLRCNTCKQALHVRRSVLLGHKLQCNHCLWKGRFDDAMTCNATIVGTHPHTHKIARLELSCGHTVERQYGRVAAAARGPHTLGCESCREQRHANDAIGSGWRLVGQTAPRKINYRSYQHHCGHLQDHAIVNVDRGQVDCAGCGESWSSKPSCIYLFKIPLPHGTLLKFGYSNDPERRLRQQLGEAARDHGTILHAIDLPTGHAAQKAEKKAHRFLSKTHPALVADRSRFNGQIKTKSEVYLLSAESLIRQLMDAIAATIPNDLTLQKNSIVKRTKTKTAASAAE